MLGLLTPLGDRVLDSRELETDKAECRKVGSCGVGKKALYLGGRYVSRRYYIPWFEVERVFKRVAMSPGGFSGKGAFGSMAYLVVQYGKGREKQCRFRTEPEVDMLLALVEQDHPAIPTHSAQAARKLAEAEAEEKPGSWTRSRLRAKPRWKSCARRKRSSKRSPSSAAC